MISHNKKTNFRKVKIMKNNKLAKIVSLIALLAALVACMFVTNVSAEENADPAIVSTNLVYGDQIQIMFATNIPTTEALGDLKVAYYKKNPATNPDAEVFYANALSADSIYNYKVDDVTYWTFVTDGVPASAVSAERFATAFYGSEIPADATYKTYSVMEYLFTRLYKQDFISKEDGTIDGNKKNLYLNMIDYTAFAQQVLVNDKTENDIKLITEYNYVYAKGASINGGGSTLILAENANVTLTLNDGMNGFEGWTVKTYNDDGTATSERFDSSVNTFAISAHTVIEPLADPTVIEFDDWAVGPVSKDSNYRITSFTEGTDAAVSNFQIVNNNGNAMLYYSNNNNFEPDTFHISAHNSSATSNVSVFETDVEWYTYNDITRSNQCVINFYSGETLVYTIWIRPNGTGTSSRLRIDGQASDGTTVGDGTSAYASAVGAKHNAVYLAPKTLADTRGDLEYQFTLKAEYYHSVENGNGVVKMYLDGANWADHIVPALDAPITSVEFQCCYNDRCNVEYAFDNVRIENTNKDFVPYAPKQ